MITRILAGAFLAATLASNPAAAQSNPKTVAAFDSYVTRAEAQIEQEQRSPNSFLAIPVGTGTEQEVHMRRGEVVIEKRGDTPTSVPGGLIHHWRGMAFLPNATIAQLLAVLQDYDHLVRYYRPDVEASRLISHQGDDFHISMRLRKHKVVTVVLDTEYDVHYGRLDATHQYSVSRSTKVSEIADAGKTSEHALPGGEDHGFMWRLNTYWRFVQAPDGVFIQCEAISLTRDVPTGLGWMIKPFIQDIPKESLQFTMSATRDAVLGTQRSK